MVKPAVYAAQSNSETTRPGGDSNPAGRFVVQDPARNQPVTTKLTYQEKQAAEAAAQALGESRSGVLRLALLHFLDVKPEARKRYVKALGGGL